MASSGAADNAKWSALIWGLVMGLIVGVGIGLIMGAGLPITIGSIVFIATVGTGAMYLRISQPKQSPSSRPRWTRWAAAIQVLAFATVLLVEGSEIQWTAVVVSTVAGLAIVSDVFRGLPGEH